MGGTDIKNLSLQIASELPKTKIISIATSSSNPNLKNCKNLQNYITILDYLSIMKILQN